MNQYLKVAKHIELEQDDKFLFVFPEIPYWLVVDDVGRKLIKSFVEEQRLQQVLNGCLPENKDAIMSFLKPLINSQVLAPKGNQSISFSSDPIPAGNAVLNITSKCNLKCKHCYLGKRKKLHDLNSDQLIDIIKDLDGTMSPKRRILSVLGGEPMLRDNLVPILRFAVDKGFFVSISTNGQIHKKDIFQEMIAIGIRTQVSIDGPDKETHEEIRGKGTWRKALKAVSLIQEVGGEPVINMVCHDGNIDRLPDYIKFARKIGAIPRFVPLVEVGSPKETGLKHVGIDRIVDVIIGLIREDKTVIPYLKSSSFMTLILTAKYSQKCRYCGSGLYTLLIDSNGDLYPCPNTMLPQFKIGNLTEQSLSYYFQSSEILARLRSLDVATLNNKCAHCAYKYFCGGGCRGETFQNTGDMCAPNIHCKSWRAAMNKIFWLLAEFPEIGNTEVDPYLPQLLHN